MSEEYMNLTETARYLGFHKTTIQRMIKTEGLPHAKIASRLRFRKKDVDEWFESKLRTFKKEKQTKKKTKEKKDAK